MHRDHLFRTLALLVIPASLLAVDRPAAGSDGRKLLGLLPEGANGVLVCDLEQARGSPVYARLLLAARKHVRLGPMLEELEASTGLDPSRDLSTLVVVSLPAKGVRLGGFVLLQGRFPRKRVEERLSADRGLVPVRRFGRQVWEKRGPAPVFSVVFLGPDLLALVHPKLLGGLLGRAGLIRGAKRPPGVRKDMAALFARPDRKDELWFAAKVPLRMRGNPDAGPLAQAEAVYGSFRLSKELRGTLSGLFLSEEMAQQLSAALMLFRARLASRPQVRALGLSQVLSRLVATPVGREARIELVLSEDELDKMITKVMSLLPRGRSKRAKAPPSSKTGPGVRRKKASTKP